MELEGKDPKNPMSWAVPMELYRENGDVVHESDQDYKEILEKNKAKVDLHNERWYEYGSRVVKYLETGELPDNHAISIDETDFDDVAEAEVQKEAEDHAKKDLEWLKKYLAEAGR